ncbi:MAG: efflux transporter outer membrane subunit [Chlamydiales bacterium]
MRQSVFFIALALLSGCKVGPNYRAPDNCITNEWHVGEVNVACPSPAWWKIFKDELLNKYISLAAHHNKDLLQAEAAICQAKGLLKVTASDLFPHVNGDLDALRTYLSKNGPIGIFEGGPARPRIPSIINLYNTIIDATWEIDFFGKVRRSIEASRAQLESLAAEKDVVLLSIFAEVAFNYFQIRSAQEHIALIEANIALLEQSWQITYARVEAGYSSRLDLEQIESQLFLARGDLPDLYADMVRGIYALSVLTGNLPETFLNELLLQKPLPYPPINVSVGLRSELLRRRPDIISAERQLAMATANIGVAVASFFPSITLFGAAGLQSLNFRNLFESRSAAWALLGDINIPIFHGGKLVGNLQASQAAQIGAIANYQQTVLQALEEAEGTLTAYKQSLVTFEQLRAAEKHAANATWITQEQFQKGLVNKIDYLNAKEELISFQLALLESKTAALLNLIALYKAVAGPFCQ